MEVENRVVVLIDMDCFYCQVEEKLNPELQGKPIAVVQYNPWKGGGIIAVNYVARDMGVTRHMRGDEAREQCPEIHLPSVPSNRGKADISRYREAGKEVARVLQKFTPLLERASIDEAYLDITAPVQERLKSLNVNSINTDMLPNTFALGYSSVDQFINDVHNYGNDSIDFDYENSKQLLVGAVIVSEIRAAVFQETGYKCSAGISHNKILAKLICGMNKPNKQTVLPKHSVNILYKTLHPKKVKHLGGKFGLIVCEQLKISTMAELVQFSEKELQAKFDEKNGTWLYNIARGIDPEPVQAKFNPKSIGCCKNFKGKAALKDIENVKKWLKELGDEIENRLEKDSLENNRTPKQMVVSFSVQMPDGKDTSSSRSYNLILQDDLNGDFFSSKAFDLLIESTEGTKPKDNVNKPLKGPIKFLGISVGKFEDHSENKTTRSITDFFTAGLLKEIKIKPTNDITEVHNSKKKNPKGKEYIMEKFLQTSEKQDKKQKIETVTSGVTDLKSIDTVLESSLDKQESFFAKLLKDCTNGDRSVKDRATTPICNIVTCGEESNDSEYSGSTIGKEINKSIALFEDDPQDVEEITQLRLLNNQSNNTKKTERLEDDFFNNYSKETNIINTKVAETFTCSDCGKVLPNEVAATHSDYHLALRLRDEDRQQARKQFNRKVNQKSPETPKKAVETKTNEQSKNQTFTSITSFLVKVDDNVPKDTCPECNKRIPIGKLPEHLDFHEAQKLSRELNKRPVRNDFIVLKEVEKKTNSVKRKRSPLSPVKKTKIPCKSIESFFSNN